MTPTREEMLIRRKEEREKNLELYYNALEKLKEDEIRLENEIQNDIQKENEEKLKEREERVNRFRRDAQNKRLRKYNILEQKLNPITLEEHKQNINNQLQEIKQKEKQHEEELKKIIEDKRQKRLQNIKPKLRREIKQEQVLVNPIHEKVNNWYNEFLAFADGRTGTDFLSYSKSEVGAVELEKLMLKYRQNLSIISRKNEHIQNLRKIMFENYLINLF